MEGDRKKNSALVMQMHFNPIGKIVRQQSWAWVWFTKAHPRRAGATAQTFSDKLDLPPSKQDIQVRDKYVLTVTVDLFGITPHAHYLGRECRVWAKDPDGKEIPLIWIKDWDFDWQEQYRYKEMIRLRAGTEINLVWTYDNTS